MAKISVVMLVEEPSMLADLAMTHLERQARKSGADFSVRVGVVIEDGEEEEDVIRFYEEKRRDGLTVMRLPVGDRSAAWRLLIERAEAVGFDRVIVLRQGESWPESTASAVIDWCCRDAGEAQQAQQVLWLPVRTRSRHPVTGRRMLLETARVVAGAPADLLACVEGPVREQWWREPRDQDDVVVMAPAATVQWRAPLAAELAHDAALLRAEADEAAARGGVAYDRELTRAAIAMAEVARTPYAKLPPAAMLRDQIYGRARAEAGKMFAEMLIRIMDRSPLDGREPDLHPSDYLAMMGAAAYYEDTLQIDRAITMYKCASSFGDRAEPCLRVAELELERAIERAAESRERGIAADSDVGVCAKNALYHARRGLSTPLPRPIDAIEIDLNAYDRLAFVGGQAALLLGQNADAEALFERALEGPEDEEIVSRAPAMLEAARQADAERASALLMGRPA